MPAPFYSSEPGCPSASLDVYDVGQDILEFCIADRSAQLKWGDVETLITDLKCWLENPF